MKLTPQVEAILDGAQARLEADGYDQGVVVEGALLGLAEAWADDERPLCPSCAHRRVPTGKDLCDICRERREAVVREKRTWWNENKPRRVTGPDGIRRYVYDHRER